MFNYQICKNITDVKHIDANISETDAVVVQYVSMRLGQNNGCERTKSSSHVVISYHPLALTLEVPEEDPRANP